MEIKKTLKTVITALEKSYVHYDWRNQGSCNCGLIAQAILNLGAKEVKDRFSTEGAAVAKKNGEFKSGHGFTWKEVVQYTCNVTGLSSSTIIQELSSHGFRPEDIVHLEYMENKAIIQESQIDTSEADYWKKKSNLILYLKGWLRILEKADVAVTLESGKIAIEEALLRAVAAANKEKVETYTNLLTLCEN